MTPIHCSVHSNSSVANLRLESSLCTAAKSGSSRSGESDFGVTSSSSFASVIPGGSGQLIPAALVRSRYRITVVRESRTERAIWRSDKPCAESRTISDSVCLDIFLLNNWLFLLGLRQTQIARAREIPVHATLCAYLSDVYRGVALFTEKSGPRCENGGPLT